MTMSIIDLTIRLSVFVIEFIILLLSFYLLLCSLYRQEAFYRAPYMSFIQPIFLILLYNNFMRRKKIIVFNNDKI